MRLTRRRLLATGTALVASAALGGLLASTAFSRERRVGPTGGMWFSRQGEWDSGDDVVLEFVDELGNPVDFNALLLWEPTGDVEEISVRNGKLKLGRAVLKKQVDQWVDFLKAKDHPLGTENPLFVLIPTSIPVEFLAYPDSTTEPKFKSKRYVLRRAGQSKNGKKSLATCPEAKIVYNSDFDSYVPMTALIDSSSKAFGEYIDFSFLVNGSTLTINAYGSSGVFNDWLGVQYRIPEQYTWSTGNLNMEGGNFIDFSNDGENGSVFLEQSIWRVLVVEKYDIYTCTRESIYSDAYLKSTNLKVIGFKAVPNYFQSLEFQTINNYTGVDGRAGSGNLFRLVDLQQNMPPIDVDVRLNARIPIGPILVSFNIPYVRLFSKAHAGFDLKIYQGTPAYVSSIATDAPSGVPYKLQLAITSASHYFKDYVFSPAAPVGRLID